jgi:serine/threonine protein phosphatase PrpC
LLKITYLVCDIYLDDDLAEVVLRAARETAIAYYDTSDEFELRRIIFKNCQKITNIETFRSLLAFDEHLPECRSTNLEHLAPDGQTPLHACATHNNAQGFHVLVNEFHVDTWQRDLRGRTALHIAAENGHHDMCRLLRDAMNRQRNIDPIGPKAPLDLAGTTPLGGACHRKRGIMPEIANALFRPGDKTILPRTPISSRVGMSPWKPPYSRTESDLVYAFSEAQGWSRRMEDRMIAVSPVPGRKTWSLFAVFDGHGGSFCSQYLSENFPKILVVAADLVVSLSSSPDASSFQSIDDSPEMLRRTMIAACMQAEDALKNHPRLKVRKVGTKYRCHDNSGSTGVIALVTPRFIIVGNVGDSRAVLCRVPDSGPSVDSAMTSELSLGYVKAMSCDHKFYLKAEVRRAIAAGARSAPLLLPSKCWPRYA